MTDAEIAVERLTDWITRHADHKQRAFIDDVTLVLAIATEDLRYKTKLLSLIRRAYTVLHKEHWQEGESPAEVASAINDFMSSMCGSEWST